MLFSRRDARGKAVGGFWQWWPSVRGRVESAIASGQWSDVTDEVNARVSAIHPDLQWEFAKGNAARHALVVTAAGDPRLRATAARWHAAAPAADDTWEYHAARQPDPNAFTATRLETAGYQVPLADTRFAFLLDSDRCQIDVVCYHPVFAEAPEEVRRQVTFLTLDWLLGEEAVELWIGGVNCQPVRPDDAQPAQVLAEQVAQLAAQYAKPVWALLSARDPDGYPIIGTIQQPLKPARWPRFDMHVSLTLPYQQDDVGLPSDTALMQLRAFEDKLTTALRRDGALVAHESTRGHRTLHIYADNDGAFSRTVHQMARTWSGGKAVVRIDLDPEFNAIAHLRA